MYATQKIVTCLIFLFSLTGKSQDSINPKEPKQQAGFDIYFLSCGDTAGDFYLSNYDFSALKNTEWKATNLGFSFHWFYKLKRCTAGLRAGLINDASLYHAWEDLNGSSPRNQDRNLVVRHSKIAISPTIKFDKKFDKKIKWLTADFSLELPIMFADKINRWAFRDEFTL
ncbi:MAG: hypothetical protein IAF38_17655 [Bacteroidia bacterium]|nr:hypothetical protein [Bacteroidia bacterium]